MFPVVSVSPSNLCFALSRSVHFLFERQRSPAAHFVRRTVQRLVRPDVLLEVHYALRSQFSYLGFSSEILLYRFL